DSQVSLGESRPHSYSIRYRSLERARANQHIGTGGNEAIDLLPCRIANPVSSELVRKAVQHTKFFFANVHLIVLSIYSGNTCKFWRQRFMWRQQAVFSLIRRSTNDRE